MDLKNAVVLITGGSSGIGRAAAEALAKAGARVAITGRDPARLAAAARQLGVVGIQADVANEADVLRTFGEVKEKLGDLDILINNAGVGVFKELIDMDRANFDAVFATNVTGAMLMAREAARIFKERKRGNLINISSTAGLRGRAQRHGLLRQQIRPARDDRVLARRATQVQRARLPDQSERSDHRLRQPGWVSAEGQPEQAAERGHRAHDPGGARDERPRLYAGTFGLRDESRGLSLRAFAARWPRGGT